MNATAIAVRQELLGRTSCSTLDCILPKLLPLLPLFGWCTFPVIHTSTADRYHSRIFPITRDLIWPCGQVLPFCVETYVVFIILPDGKSLEISQHFNRLTTRRVLFLYFYQRDSSSAHPLGQETPQSRTITSSLKSSVHPNQFSKLQAFFLQGLNLRLTASNPGSMAANATRAWLAAPYLLPHLGCSSQEPCSSSTLDRVSTRFGRLRYPLGSFRSACSSR
jgi:hypothetical protein